jgi:hypothetical protein
VWTVPTGSLPPDTPEYALLQGSNSSSGAMTISWSGSVTTSVRVYEAPGCRAASLACAQGAPIHSWSVALSGSWSSNGPLVFPYLVIWNTTDPNGGTWGLTAVETQTTSIPTALWQTAVIDAAGAALAVIGAVALFLGLFLRGGAFSGPAPIVSRSADDVEEIAGPPRTPK